MWGHREDKVEKVQLDVNTTILDMIMHYIFTNNIHITRKSLTNIKKFMDIWDSSMYTNDIDFQWRIFIINESLRLKIDENIHNEELILTHLATGEFADNVYMFYDDMNQVGGMTADEITGMNKYISDRLKFSYLYKDKVVLEACLQKLDLGQFDSLRDINDEFKQVINRLQRNIRNAEADDLFETKIDLRPEVFDNAILDAVMRLKEPSNKYRSGLKMLNEMINGGFEQGRVYTFLGITGGGNELHRYFSRAVA